MKRAMIERLVTLSTAAFGLVAALAWNDTIKLLFKTLFGEQKDLLAMFLYAVLVTIAAVVVTFYIGRIADRKKK